MVKALSNSTTLLMVKLPPERTKGFFILRLRTAVVPWR